MIVGIIIGSLVALSLVFCLVRCLCCGAQCCCACMSCCAPRRRRPRGHQPLPSAAPPHYPVAMQPYAPAQPYVQATPAVYGSIRTAQFDASSQGGASTRVPFNEDALPAMPTWGEAKEKHVEDTSEPEPVADEVEMDSLAGTTAVAAKTGSPRDLSQARRPSDMSAYALPSQQQQHYEKTSQGVRDDYSVGTQYGVQDQYGVRDDYSVGTQYGVQNHYDVRDRYGVPDRPSPHPTSPLRVPVPRVGTPQGYFAQSSTPSAYNSPGYGSASSPYGAPQQPSRFSTHNPQSYQRAPSSPGYSSPSYGHVPNNMHSTTDPYASPGGGYNYSTPPYPHGP